MTIAIIIVLAALLILSLVKFVQLKGTVEKKVELEKKTEQLEKEVKSLEYTKGRLENNRSTLEASIENIRKERERLDGLVRGNQEKIRDLDARIQNANVTIKKLVDDAKGVAEERLNSEMALLKEKQEREALSIHETLLNGLKKERDSLTSSIEPLKAELLEYQKKRESLNEALRRERELEMQKDFYRLALKSEDKDDIQFLLSIESKIHNQEVLRKLIWATYLQPAANQMYKRVLANENPSGIYRITDSSGFSYIGKSVKIKDRWSEHLKSSLSIGTIASQSIHEALKNRGWDDFTWEVLEKCDKDSLTEREKYYISFYESTMTGYNMKSS